VVPAHLACNSIWSGESEVAFVGGVNIMTAPGYFISMSKGGFLSPHGYCKTFDKDATGYARGEGAKPLSDAINNQDHIYAVIRATGTNQDGHTDGIAMPMARRKSS